MNPFDLPPTTPAVSNEPPAPGSAPASGRSRGRAALAVVAALGLVGAGVVGLSRFAAADPSQAEPASATPDSDDAEPIDPVEETDEGDEVSTDDEATDDEATDDGDGDGDEPELDGEIVLDDGDGDPFVIDLGELDEGLFDRLAECVGIEFSDDLPRFEFDVEGPFGHFEHHDEHVPHGGFPIIGDDGTHITVLGPDGVSVIDLGDGDGSVTISQEDGDVTIETEGDVTVSDLAEVVDRWQDWPGERLPRWGELDEDGLGELPAIGEWFERFDPPDPDEIEACLDDLTAGSSG